MELSSIMEVPSHQTVCSRKMVHFASNPTNDDVVQVEYHEPNFVLSMADRTNLWWSHQELMQNKIYDARNNLRKRPHVSSHGLFGHCIFLFFFLNSVCLFAAILVACVSLPPS